MNEKPKYNIMGRPPAFNSPEELGEQCDAYLNWVEENPLYEAKLVSFQGESTVEKLPKMRAMIREADFIVCNDTGLAHAAAAMNKPMTILWKNTSLPKNGNPGRYTNIKLCQ